MELCLHQKFIKEMQPLETCEITTPLLKSNPLPMDSQTSTFLSLPLLSPDPLSLDNFNSLFTHMNTVLSSPYSPSTNPVHTLKFSSTSLTGNQERLTFPDWLKPVIRCPPNFHNLLKKVSVIEHTLVGASAGGIAGAFTHVCLHPIDTIKTKLQTQGASQIYKNTLDVVAKTFQEKGIVGFYSGVSAVAVGSTVSSAMYFGTCEFGKMVLGKLPQFPPVLIPPAAGAMGNIVSSAIMVPKELITQRMQAGAKGRFWEVILRILEKDGVLGLYAGYSATLLRNLPAGVLSYSSFEYLKAALLNKKKSANLEPFESVYCGALAGAVAAILTTPLDVVKTRLMTQVQMNKIGLGVMATVKHILKEEGWAGLTRGMGPRVVHTAGFSALGYFAFETARLTILHQYLRCKKLEETNVESNADSSN